MRGREGNMWWLALTLACRSPQPAGDELDLGDLSKSVPPARPMIRSLPAASMMSAVTVVPERIIRPSYSPMICLSCSGGRPVRTST